MLCAFFWLLAIWTYTKQAVHTGARPAKMLVPNLLTLCALLAKPMAVTLPFTRGGGALESASGVSLTLRIANAAVSYVAYLAKGRSSYSPTTAT